MVKVQQQGLKAPVLCADTGLVQLSPLLYLLSPLADKEAMEANKTPVGEKNKCLTEPNNSVCVQVCYLPGM